MKTTFRPRLKRTFTPPSATRGGQAGVFYKDPEEPLTGEVNGLKASQDEERLIRSVRKGMGKGRVRNFFFRYSPLVPRNSPGWKELDMLVMGNGRVWAIMLQETNFIHRNGSEREQDKLNQAILLDRLRKIGYSVDKIILIPNEKARTQELADKTAKELGIL